ncbi:tripartite tricarboxylate transporter substrate binding protein [Aquabacterium sp. J223]|uniref:Bug family tripartite tricarboxylate transporter substrate binding protein n=1 Tax=Aquabacterium sp. J223 TaxID=2898431 RepID=UPI0021AD6EA0|nr:tripartite tricarboxylate transporter substrate binding protein [Aquabacterium sp. J223]UUX94368.1 tripartite tricarboxylate transporter substrate binding protein [Aquabacterium sp. J223]
MNRSTLPPLRRRSLLAAGAAAGLGLGAGAARAETAAEYPSKPGRIVLSNAAGTAPDVAARAVAQRFQELMGKPFVVDNRPGAGGTLAAEAVLSSPADGYTLLFGTMSEIALTPHVYKSVRYDPLRDFAPLGELGSADLLLVVNPERAPTNSLDEYLAWARQRQPLLAGTFGVGNPAHLSAMQFGDAAKLKVEPVHFRAPGEGIAGITSGDIHALFASVALALPFLRSGKLKALAVTSSSRSPVLPDVPTAREIGLAPMEAVYWFGMFAPARTPVPILDKLSDATVASLRAPDTKRKLEETGFRITGTARQPFAQMLATDLPKWAEAVRRYGMRAD